MGFSHNVYIYIYNVCTLRENRTIYFQLPCKRLPPVKSPTSGSTKFNQWEAQPPTGRLNQTQPVGGSSSGSLYRLNQAQPVGAFSGGSLLYGSWTRTSLVVNSYCTCIKKYGR